MPIREIMPQVETCDSVRDVIGLLKGTNMASAGLAFQILSVVSFAFGMLSFLILFPGDMLPQRVLKRRLGTFVLVLLQWAVLIPFLVLYVRLNRIRSLLTVEMQEAAAKCGIQVHAILTDGKRLHTLDINRPLSIFLACFGTCLAVVLTLRFLRMTLFSKPSLELPLNQNNNAFGKLRKNKNYIQAPSSFILHPRRPQKVAVCRNVHWSDSGELRDHFWSDDEY